MEKHRATGGREFWKWVKSWELQTFIRVPLWMKHIKLSPDICKVLKRGSYNVSFINTAKEVVDCLEVTSKKTCWLLSSSGPQPYSLFWHSLWHTICTISIYWVYVYIYKYIRTFHLTFFLASILTFYLTFYLAFYLAFCPTSILAFYLAFSLAFSSGVLSARD